MRHRIGRHVVFVMAALIGFSASAANPSRTVLHHVHGLAFTPDGKFLMVPAHVGLAVYRDGRWRTAPGAPHDFMGFSVGKNAIYTSGHPAPSSPLRNPLGLMKSTDGGASWQQLGLAGEADFHVMAAGYASNAIHVVNAEPNSRMHDTGLHITLDEGKSWKRAASSGLSGEIINLAAHPTEAGMVAIGTTTGLHVSQDHGAAFKRIGANAAVTAVSFDFDGKHLYFSAHTSDKLHRIALHGTQATAVSLPPLQKDFVLYVAQNPRASDELAIATRRRNVYLSHDGGRTWQLIARDGEAVLADAQAMRKELKNARAQ